MKKIQFRYVFKHKEINSFRYLYYSINEIEEGIATQNIKLMDAVGFKLIARDRYIGLSTFNKKEIYENDIFIHVDINWGYGGKYDKIHDGYLRTQVPCIEELLIGNFDYEFIQFQSYEIIGNIYENHELIN